MNIDTDPYLETKFAANRLFTEWKKHGRLIVACDFDDTVFDFHNTKDGESKYSHEYVISLLQDCQALNFYITIFTASAPARWNAIRVYMKEKCNIEITGVNVNPIPLPFGNNGKMYYNILLDDRAGLGQSVKVLEFTIQLIKRHMKVKKATVITAPHSFLNPAVPGHLKLFLAGSIEMGRAEEWQNELIKELESFDFTILNPRRPDWDNSWEQSKDNPKFREQVQWELDALRCADIIAVYLSPGTVSPISLLETGLFLDSGRTIICCPPGFARKGNIDITCENNGIPVHENWTDFVKAIKEAYDSYFEYSF